MIHTLEKPIERSVRYMISYPRYICFTLSFPWSLEDVHIRGRVKQSVAVVAKNKQARKQQS